MMAQSVISRIALLWVSALAAGISGCGTQVGNPDDEVPPAAKDEPTDERKTPDNGGPTVDNNPEVEKPTNSPVSGQGAVFGPDVRPCQISTARSAAPSAAKLTLISAAHASFAATIIFPDGTTSSLAEIPLAAAGEYRVLITENSSLTCQMTVTISAEDLANRVSVTYTMP